MRLFRVEGWLESPLDRDVIERWTVGNSYSSSYRLVAPQPATDKFTIFAFGDTGDSEAAGPYISPQDAVAREMALDCEPNSVQPAAILHTGDVVYMTGERRCYDRNFRRPYQCFLEPESTVDDLRFRTPFLPVPGNHDYYDLGVWARFLARVPLLGRGLRSLANQLFTFSLPTGGSGMGGAYMNAFVDLHADTTKTPLPYIPGVRTRIPNRYYAAQIGSVDLFAIDSTTLEAPAPGANEADVRLDATSHIKELERRSRTLDAQLRRDQRALEDWRSRFRDALMSDDRELTGVRDVVIDARDSLERLATTLGKLEDELPSAASARQAMTTVLRRWQESSNDLLGQSDPAALVETLRSLDEASDGGCEALEEVELCLSLLPDGKARQDLLPVHERVVQSLHRWAMTVSQAPAELSQALQQLSDEALDVQREIALERRRLRYRPADYDSAQLAWLERSLSQSVCERPNSWRIVYLHHPLFTTIGNHCERPDILAVRENVIEILRGRVDAVLSGHSHAFEWLRNTGMPYTAFCVTGGGGALSLRNSILDPRRLHRNRERYESMRRAGISECIAAGKGPAAADGESGPLYHYLRIEVTPDELTIRPVGVRKLASGYRREQPLRVHHAPDLPVGRPAWSVKHLDSVVVRHGAEPLLQWAPEED